MQTAFEDANVTGYECLITSMTNDAKDRHVLAAAVRCGAHAIVTNNVRHFPPQAVKPYDIDVLTADEFLLHQFHLDPELMLEKMLQQAITRGVDFDALVTRLQSAVPHTCAAMEAFRQ